MVRPADADFMARSGRSTLLLLLVLALLLLPSQAWGLSVEEQQLREAEAQRAAGRSELPRLGFGLDAVLDTAEGINRDRPSSSSTLIVTPQLKVGSTVRVKAELWLQVNHLAREDNPWDVPYTSLALSDLSLYREPKSGINLSGALAYYLPFSIDERNRDSYGNLRANLGLGRSLGPVRLSFGLTGIGYFSRCTTSDPSRWHEEDNIASNPAWGLMESYQLSYSPTEQLSFTAVWQMKQVRDHADGVSELAGMDAGQPRRTDAWKHSFGCILDMTYTFTKKHISFGRLSDCSQPAAKWWT